jgi:hypothetical protein
MKLISSYYNAMAEDGIAFGANCGLKRGGNSYLRVCGSRTIAATSIDDKCFALHGIQMISAEEPFLRPVQRRWIPSEMITAPLLNPSDLAAPIEPHYAWLINPF